jgi:hypothetical protein
MQFFQYFEGHVGVVVERDGDILGLAPDVLVLYFQLR